MMSLGLCWTIALAALILYLARLPDPSSLPIIGRGRRRRTRTDLDHHRHRRRCSRHHYYVSSLSDTNEVTSPEQSPTSRSL
jgi:hypothetical protein